jgi:Secretion system C-terminal sorting domain
VNDTSVPPRGSVNSFASFGNNLFVATDSDGIFLTTDYGASWTRENLGLGDSNIISLAVQGNELLAGTASSGVWHRPLAEMIPSSSVASGKQIVDTISVYPDPASSIVTVSCPGLTGTTEASLISETGATVWRKTITTNSQPFQLDFTGIANGAYRLELNSGGVSQASKIVLQR